MTVSAHSDGPGAGSEFVVRLPRSNAPAGLEATGDLNSAAVPTVSSSDTALKILVVDDSIDGAEMLAARVEGERLHTHVAFDGLVSSADRRGIPSSDSVFGHRLASDGWLRTRRTPS